MRSQAVGTMAEQLWFLRRPAAAAPDAARRPAPAPAHAAAAQSATAQLVAAGPDSAQHLP